VKENPTLNDIKISIANGPINLNRYTFLGPISIGHLAIACKIDDSLIDRTKCTSNAASFLSRLNFYNYVGPDDPFDWWIFSVLKYFIPINC